MSEGKTTRVPCGHCPRCGYKLDAASSPRPADPTLCLRCGLLLVFDDELRPRAPSARELLEWK
jgi:hypothetical protein